VQPIASYGEANLTYFRVKSFKAVEAFLFSLKVYKFFPAVIKST
jgi:hypothetical protein